MSVHIPVMLNEVIKYIAVSKNDIVIDCTLGGGSYTKAIAKIVGKNGLVLAIDLDKEAISRFKKESSLNVKIIEGNFADLENIALENNITYGTCKAIVFDLGLSSDQLADRKRGFSFQDDGPLDMSFSQDLNKETINIINSYSVDDLTSIFKNYSEDTHAYRVARAIVSFRRKERIVRVKQLVSIISEIVKKGKIHPATKVFQALRIETNRELDNLKKALPSALKLLKKGGKIAVVSFHSTEDRIVKNFFRDMALNCNCLKTDLICKCKGKQLEVLTKKPIIPSEEEVEDNKRARSAKLRVAKKL